MRRSNLAVLELAKPRHPLRAMEDQIDNAIEGNAQVTLAMLEAKRALSLPTAAGHHLLDRNLRFGARLAAMRGEAVAMHAACLDFLKTQETAYGDQWDCDKRKMG